MLVHKSWWAAEITTILHAIFKCTGDTLIGWPHPYTSTPVPELWGTAIQSSFIPIVGHFSQIQTIARCMETLCFNLICHFIRFVWLRFYGHPPSLIKEPLLFHSDTHGRQFTAPLRAGFCPLELSRRRRLLDWGIIIVWSCLSVRHEPRWNDTECGRKFRCFGGALINLFGPNKFNCKIISFAGPMFCAALIMMFCNLWNNTK